MMQNNITNWLPHLEGAVPLEARRNKLGMYSIALEGWRRGLTLKFYKTYSGKKEKIKYSLSYGEKKHKFYKSAGDKVTKEAVKICINKSKTKEYLSKAGVPVPKGKKFEVEATDEEIIKYSESMGFPLVVKPIDQYGGKGVISNIQDIESLKKALFYVRQELKFPEVLVEQFIPGDEFRIYVVGNKVIGAVNRVPANVVGDGINSIKNLIDMKNRERRKNPNLYLNPIKIDQELLNTIHSSGFTLESIPEEGERIFLRNNSNVSMGGDPIDVTDELSPEITNIALKAVKAVPGLAQCGLDMIVDKKNNSGVVIELNSKPMLGLHLFPVEGRARDVSKAIIDYYFPETINIEKSNLYFDFDRIIQILKDNIAKSVTVSPTPIGKIYAKKYIITGKVQGVGYRNWIKRKALSQNLHGYTKNLKNGKVVVVVSSPNKEDVDRFKNICSQGPTKAEVRKVTEYSWDKPLKVGFEIKENTTIRKLKEELQVEKNEKEDLKKGKEAFKKRYLRIKNSRTWRYTSPMRNVIDLFKRIYISK